MIKLAGFTITKDLISHPSGPWAHFDELIVLYVINQSLKSNLLFCPQPLELICEKAIATCNRPLGAGEALRRVMECLASGILLPGMNTSRKKP